MSNFQLTIFRNLYDTATHRQMSLKNWEGLKALLYKLSQRQLKSKRDSELISPAVYAEGTTRANANVEHWGKWAAIDVDAKIETNDLESYLKERIGNYSYVVYSTASSTKQHPKFRVVFPLTTRVKPDNIRAFWFALSEEMALETDPQCKDYSRMYYAPGTYECAFNFYFTNEGEMVNPIELRKKHKYVERNPTRLMQRLPKEVQKAIMTHRANQMNNFDVSWTCYQDCEFVPRNLLQEYDRIAYTDGSGRYHMIYQIMSAIAVNAVKKRYPITADDIVRLIREIDRDRSNIYQKRPLKTEAKRAIDFAYSVEIV